MVDEKDRFGEKIHESEKAREDQWARQRDMELMEKMRQKAAAAMHCPKCGKALVERTSGGIHILACADNHGAWLEAAALENLLKK